MLTCTEEDAVAFENAVNKLIKSAMNADERDEAVIVQRWAATQYLMGKFHYSSSFGSGIAVMYTEKNKSGCVSAI